MVRHVVYELEVMVYVELVDILFYRYANTVSKKSEYRQVFFVCKRRREICGSIFTIFHTKITSKRTNFRQVMGKEVCPFQ